MPPSEYFSKHEYQVLCDFFDCVSANTNYILQAVTEWFFSKLHIFKPLVCLKLGGTLRL